MPSRPVVMISSTARDLPAHRAEAMTACLQAGFFPTMMDFLPASDADAIAASLRMVDEAKIYLGIFGHRYGHVPAGHPISITEMEYDRAIERKIPRMIFLMDDDHPIRIADVEFGPAAEKLKTLKERLLREQVVALFTSPAYLRAWVLHSLTSYRDDASRRRPGKRRKPNQKP